MDSALVDRVVWALATSLHEAWRLQWFAANGTGAPRRKPAGVSLDAIPAGPLDSAGQDPISGEVWLDIAARPFALLTPKWQAENLTAARVAVECVLDPGLCTVAQMGHAIHEAWLDRHRAYAPPHQLLPFADLSWDEQHKDLLHLTKAAQGLLAHAAAPDMAGLVDPYGVVRVKKVLALVDAAIAEGAKADAALPVS